MVRSAFERLPMSADAQRAYLERELQEIDVMVDAVRETSSKVTVEHLQRMRLKTQQRVEKALGKLAVSKDGGISFESCGLDSAFIDEAHGYKSLLRFSNIAGMAIEGARRSSFARFRNGSELLRRVAIAGLGRALGHVPGGLRLVPRPGRLGRAVRNPAA